MTLVTVPPPGRGAQPSVGTRHDTAAFRNPADGHDPHPSPATWRSAIRCRGGPPAGRGGGAGDRLPARVRRTLAADAAARHDLERLAARSRFRRRRLHRRELRDQRVLRHDRRHAHYALDWQPDRQLCAAGPQHQHAEPRRRSGHLAGGLRQRLRSGRSPQSDADRQSGGRYTRTHASDRHAHRSPAGNTGAGGRACHRRRRSGAERGGQLAGRQWRRLGAAAEHARGPHRTCAQHRGGTDRARPRAVPCRSRRRPHGHGGHPARGRHLQLERGGRRHQHHGRHTADPAGRAVAAGPEHQLTRRRAGVLAGRVRSRRRPDQSAERRLHQCRRREQRRVPRVPGRHLPGGSGLRRQSAVPAEPPILHGHGGGCRCHRGHRSAGCPGRGVQRRGHRGRHRGAPLQCGRERRACAFGQCRSQLLHQQRRRWLRQRQQPAHHAHRCQRPRPQPQPHRRAKQQSDRGRHRQPWPPQRPKHHRRARLALPHRARAAGATLWRHLSAECAALATGRRRCGRAGRRGCRRLERQRRPAGCNELAERRSGHGQQPLHTGRTGRLRDQRALRARSGSCGGLGAIPHRSRRWTAAPALG